MADPGKYRHRETMFTLVIICVIVVGAFVLTFRGNSFGQNIIVSVLTWFGAKKYFRQ